MGADNNTATTAKRKPRGKPFPKGVSANPAGRPVGAKNRATKDAKEFCSELVDSPEYREALRLRLLNGTAGPMEALAWAYAKGKPVDRVETGGPGAFADVGTDELKRRLAAALDRL